MDDITAGWNIAVRAPRRTFRDLLRQRRGGRVSPALPALQQQQRAGGSVASRAVADAKSILAQRRAVRECLPPLQSHSASAADGEAVATTAADEGGGGRRGEQLDVRASMMAMLHMHPREALCNSEVRGSV